MELSQKFSTRFRTDRNAIYQELNLWIDFCNILINNSYQNDQNSKFLEKIGIKCGYFSNFLHQTILVWESWDSFNNQFKHCFTILFSQLEQILTSYPSILYQTKIKFCDPSGFWDQKELEDTLILIAFLSCCHK